MNERIRELSDIAYKNHLARNPNSSFGRRYDYDRELAELIVRECVSIVAKRKDQAIDDGWNVDEAMSMAEMDLEEHFGVEE
jgi:hypothetical protein